ncbi:MAG: hypothetical protein J5725_13275 [Bacteroidales bacterium]|nr:hypothetical protein [Bacteroidales bacterium]
MSDMSREEAIKNLNALNAILGNKDFYDKEFEESIRMGREALENQKTGHWILADKQSPEDVSNDNYRYICSECDHSDIQSKAVTVPYCWFCGAKMEGE